MKNMLAIYICTFLFLIKPNIVVLLNSSDLSKPNFGENFPVAISKSNLPSKTLQVCNDDYFLYLNPHFFIKPISWSLFVVENDFHGF